jgi:hypothetical protein
VEPDGAARSRASASAARASALVLSNEYGSWPLTVGAAHLALAGKSAAITPGSDRVLTFGGQRTAIIPPGAPLLSESSRLEGRAAVPVCP